MSASAYGQVIYGFKTEYSLLHVANGTKKVCRSYNHPCEDNYCPKCGSPTHVIDAFAPSPQVIKFAQNCNVSVEDALAILSPYNHTAPRALYDTKPSFIFGLVLVDGGTNSFNPFVSMTSRKDELTQMENIFHNLGFDPTQAEYFLLVSLS